MASQGKLKKALTLADLTFLGLGAIIGSGWLFASQSGAQLAGSEAWIAWVFGAIAVMFIGLVYAELGAALPRTGGIIRYPEYTHGSLVGYIMGFASLLAYSSVAGIEAQAVRQYATYYLPGLSVKGSNNYTLAGLILEIAFLVLFFLLNYWSVQVFGKINSIVTALKFILPLLTLIILLFNMHPASFAAGGASPGGVKGIFSAVSTAGIVFAFLGFRQAIDFAGEAKNPQRNVPLAIILAISLGAIIYILLQVSFVGAMPAADLTKGWAAVNFNSPFANLAMTLGFGWLASLLFIDAVISPAGTGNIYLSSTARVLFAWSRNGYFYSIFGKLNKKTGLPRPALWLSFILSIVWILPGNFHSWQGLVGAVTSATVLTYVFGPVSAAAMRRAAPELKRPFRLGGMSIIAPLAFIAGSWIVYWTGWTVDKLLISMTIGSLVLYLAFMDKGPDSITRLKRDWKSGIWVIVYYLFLGVMSYIGSFGPLKKPIIPGPWWDSIVVGVGSLVFYYWGVASRLRVPDFSTDKEAEEIGELAVEV
ncbi:APC family permease [Alicyclobacillus tolerans]|uniref:Amino acid transporter n=2 Tax=Alicyclobacillus tolerans TaxID=90970 RepID=A0ABT9LTG7_9BACL|nr:MULTISPECIES: APC family permease [Alicyclobacillus]MDP9727556.1 amino acid transporter [Alicyclobacillus tengchongensis]QRF23991.1 APC family permease [Alicyclobacillus sp. TC]SHJ66890.1 aspartate/glutamate:proton symporter, AGT family [Alicyclobacillus montanus]